MRRIDLLNNFAVVFFSVWLQILPATFLTFSLTGCSSFDRSCEWRRSGPQIVRTDFSLTGPDLFDRGGTVHILVDGAACPALEPAQMLGAALLQAAPRAGVTCSTVIIREPTPNGRCSINDSTNRYQPLDPSSLQLTNGSLTSPADRTCVVQVLECRPYVPQRLTVHITVTDQASGIVVAATTATWSGGAIPVVSRREFPGWRRRQRSQRVSAGDETIRLSPEEFIKKAAEDISFWILQTNDHPIMVIDEASDATGDPSMPVDALFEHATNTP